MSDMLNGGIMHTTCNHITLWGPRIRSF